MTKEAADHNWRILERFDLDLSKAIEAQKDSPVGYGSEFRHPDVLDKLLFRHPRWEQLRRILLHGSDFLLEELPAEMQQKDLQEARERGNHKSARDRPDKLKELVLNDITNGFSVVLPLEKIALLPGAVIAPYGIAEQGTIDETGRIIKKDRLTQTCRFSSRQDDPSTTEPISTTSTQSSLETLSGELSITSSTSEPDIHILGYTSRNSIGSQRTAGLTSTQRRQSKQ